MSNTFSGQARSNIRRLIIFTFFVGALFATAIFLGLASVGFIEAGPLYHSTFGPKSVVILYFDGPPFELVPYFNQSSQYHTGALGYGSGFTLNSTSVVSGTISSTAGIDWFLWSITNGSDYLLKPSFNASASMATRGFVFTTGNAISTHIEMMLPAGKYAWFALDPYSVPSNITSDTRLTATPLS